MVINLHLNLGTRPVKYLDFWKIIVDDAHNMLLLQVIVTAQQDFTSKTHPDKIIIDAAAHLWLLRAGRTMSQGD